MKLFTLILGWILYHANRGPKDRVFYSIKTKLLERFGRMVCYDVQFIEGKLCYSCNGTGIYSMRTDNYGFPSEVNYCRNCHKGWYKRHTWNILKRIELGSYEFHIPWERVYSRPEISTSIFGYIEHYPTKYTNFCRDLLFLVFRKSHFEARLRRKWRNFCYYKIETPYRNIRYRLRRKKIHAHIINSDELPF